MTVTFSGKWAVNHETFGVNFEADKEGQRIVCVISTEALQDINPVNAMDTAEQQFLANQLAFESIARELIEAGQDKDGFLHIHSQHVAN